MYKRAIIGLIVFGIGSVTYATELEFSNRVGKQWDRLSNWQVRGGNSATVAAALPGKSDRLWVAENQFLKIDVENAQSDSVILEMGASLAILAGGNLDARYVTQGGGG